MGRDEVYVSRREVRHGESPAHGLFRLNALRIRRGQRAAVEGRRVARDFRQNTRAPFCAAERSSSTKAAPPSPGTKPRRSLSNGRDEASGER